MSSQIACPSCHATIEITEVMQSQLTAKIRLELEEEVRAKRDEVDAVRKQLEEQRLAAKQVQESLEQQISQRVENARAAILAEAAKAASEKFAVELKDRSAEVEELQAKLKESQSHELDLRERERKLRAQADELKLAASREVDSQREDIRQQALKQFAAEHQLKDAEHQKMVAELKKQIDDLKRKAEQGSQQTQGEVQELALEELLEELFPSDTISPVPKGVCGGDALQKVFCKSGVECGDILWESKRTKNWNNSWLPKVRDDLRASRAHCAVIVTETPPGGVDTFSLIDGVWVCRWSCVAGLAMALRSGLIDLGKQRLAEHGRQEKTQLVYSYLSSKEFQQRVAESSRRF